MLLMVAAKGVKHLGKDFPAHINADGQQSVADLHPQAQLFLLPLLTGGVPYLFVHSLNIKWDKD